MLIDIGCYIVILTAMIEVVIEFYIIIIPIKPFAITFNAIGQKCMKG